MASRIERSVRLQATRAECLETLTSGLTRTTALGVTRLMLHGGLIPEAEDEGRKAFVDTLGQAAVLSKEHGVTLGLETGQETADLVRCTLDDLTCDNVTTPGEWGQDVPLGEGQVNMTLFVETRKKLGYAGLRAPGGNQ